MVRKPLEGSMLRVDRRVIDRFLDDDMNALTAILGISQYLGPRDFDDPELGMTRPEFNLELYNNYTGEVINGGHGQFFLNPYGGFASRTLEALNEMGLENLSEILREACSVFADSSVPTDENERESAIRALPPEAFEAWNALDYRHWKEDHRHGDVLAYLRRHRMHILGPENV
jgi:Domain of unknown function (DUF4375)